MTSAHPSTGRRAGAFARAVCFRSNRSTYGLPTLVVISLAACSTAALPPVPEEAPLFRRIDAHVGTAYADAARSATIANPLLHVEVGVASVARFEKAFAAMFARAEPLPEQPPWREGVNHVDGVIELESASAELVVGNDHDRPDSFHIAYRVCLYDRNGAEVRCWTPAADYSHQRAIGECLDLRPCLVPEIEIAVREAIARFLVEAENDPVLRTWAARIATHRSP